MEQTTYRGFDINIFDYQIHSKTVNGREFAHSVNSHNIVGYGKNKLESFNKVKVILDEILDNKISSELELLSKIEKYVVCADWDGYVEMDHKIFKLLMKNYENNK